MNTPAHAIVNLLLLPGQRRRAFLPVLLGALIPDVPIVLFYGWARLVARLPERIIWTSAYHGVGWQALIDTFHSFPLLGVACFISRRLRAPRCAAFFASMFLHSCFDFPLHHDDAHRHFFPLSDWRFHSPVSYWDPRYFGGIFSSMEVLIVVAGGVWLARKTDNASHRRWIVGIVSLYLAFWGFAAVVWM